MLVMLLIILYTFAKLFGLEGNQALLSTNKATEKPTGFNPMQLLGIELKMSIKPLT